MLTIRRASVASPPTHRSWSNDNDSIDIRLADRGEGLRLRRELRQGVKAFVGARICFRQKAFVSAGAHIEMKAFVCADSYAGMKAYGGAGAYVWQKAFVDRRGGARRGEGRRRSRELRWGEGLRWRWGLR
ncbi:hypothetical protein ACHAWF_009441 [Thalassiosira exigua]